jgi:uncharacterized Zn-binding protein involved in type VI secretion
MAGKPAAYLTGSTQHGVIVGVGSPDVLIHALPAWASDYQNLCPVHGPEMVGLGSETVLINNKRAARQGDFLQGSGPPNMIMLGAQNVLIGGPEQSAYNEKDYCAAYCAFKDKWKQCKTKEEREALYKQLLADLAAKFGAPPPNVTANMTPPFPAAFDTNSWTVMVSKNAFDDGHDPPGPWATAHEMRHCEQSYMAMRSSQDTSMTSNPAVQQAVQNQGPLDPNSPAGRYGALHAENQIGGGKANYQQILHDINSSAGDPAAFDKALQAYKNQPGGEEGYAVDAMGKCGCDAYK